MEILGAKCRARKMRLNSSAKEHKLICQSKSIHQERQIEVVVVLSKGQVNVYKSQSDVLFMVLGNA